MCMYVSLCVLCLLVICWVLISGSCTKVGRKGYDGRGLHNPKILSFISKERIRGGFHSVVSGGPHLQSAVCKKKERQHALFYMYLSILLQMTFISS